MLIHTELFSNVSGLGLGLKKIFGPRPLPRPHSFWPRPWPHAQLASLTSVAVPRFRLNTYGRWAFFISVVARWPGTHSQILCGTQRAAQTVLGVRLLQTYCCSGVTNASSALGVLYDYALYKLRTHSLHLRSVSIVDLYSAPSQSL